VEAYAEALEALERSIQDEAEVVALAKRVLKSSHGYARQKTGFTFATAALDGPPERYRRLLSIIEEHFYISSW